MMLSRMFSLLFLCCLLVPPAFSQETVQINTSFRYFLGKPTWLLILRDVDSGVVLPYIYDIRSGDNFWLAFSSGRNYQVQASLMQFPPYDAEIRNFCRLEDGILRGQSLFVTVTGALTPDRRASHCHVKKYPSAGFTVVEP